MKHFLTSFTKLKIIFLIGALGFLLLPSASKAEVVSCINNTSVSSPANIGRGSRTCYSNIPDQKTADHLKNILSKNSADGLCHEACGVNNKPLFCTDTTVYADAVLLNNICSVGEIFTCLPDSETTIIPYDQSKSDSFYKACANTNLDCATDADCLFEGIAGVCRNNYCAYTPANINIMRNKLTVIPCGAERCNKIDEKCTYNGNCDQFGGGPQIGAGRCFLGSCYLDPVRESKYKNQPTLLGQKADLRIQKPLFEIRIPGLKFSDVKNTIDSEGYLHLPYLGEFMTLVYRLAMVVASILAAVMLIVNGARIVVSAGGEEKQAAYKHIGNAIIGLVILWGSYAIMYNVNPDLVNFKVLKVRYIERKEMPEVDNVMPEEAALPVIPSEIICNNHADASLVKVVPVSGLKVDAKEPYLLSGVYEALKKAAQTALNKGYVLDVTSACRNSQNQQALANKNPGGVNSGTVAKPGGSAHGFGIAVDMILLDKNTGKILVPAGNSATQCEINPIYVDALSQIMYSAGFSRFAKENWHFELPPKNPNLCRSKIFTGLSKCKPKAGECPV